MLTEYRRPPADAAVEHEIEIKRSRFICLIGRVTDDASARAFIDEARSRFPDARHHCSAYIYHVDDSHPVERSSDDGEPSGTAGKPMLDVLKGSGLMDIAAVVIRYFGGVKLGAGGLVHAYGGVVSEAIDLVRPVLRTTRHLFTLDAPHAEAGRWESELRNRYYEVLGVDYGAQATMTLAVAPGEEDALFDTIAALTQATAEAKEAGTQWVEIARNN